MVEVTTVAALRGRLAAERAAGRRIGFVPTMGFLHEGHLALVDAVRRESDVVVMSIFVNPLQFRPGEDLDRYPRDLPRDRALAAGRGVDVLFVPSAAEMYPRAPEVMVRGGAPASRWEGEHRPGHFDGVLTVVLKLLHQVAPDVVAFGQKDVQQATLIRRMLVDLDLPITMRIVPTVREPDGLALSSRNVYLGPVERIAALGLSRGLREAERAWRSGVRDGAALRAAVAAVLEGVDGVTTDYIAVADPDGLAPVTEAPAGTIVAVAARVGATRLIDNVILGEERT